jgi:hypothetical protein
LLRAIPIYLLKNAPCRLGATPLGPASGEVHRRLRRGPGQSRKSWMDSILDCLLLWTKQMDTQPSSLPRLATVPTVWQPSPAFGL